MMRFWMAGLVVIALGGCASEPPPSCHDAVHTYWRVGCVSVETGSWGTIAEEQMASECIILETQAEGDCVAPFDDWTRCLDEVAAPADQQSCDCSQQLQALKSCLPRVIDGNR